MAFASVQAIRAELLKVKGEVQLIQQQYKEHAEQRCEYQTKMAQLNQMIQQQTSTASQNDVMLVEDVIVVTLAADHAAQCRYSELPPPPPPSDKREAASTTGTTKNAEEAIQTYKAQIEMYQAEKTYREHLDAAETDMDIIFRQAVDEILDILDQYCDNVNLHRAVESFAASGNACSSPRQKRTGAKQTTLSRLLGTMNPLPPRNGSNSNNNATFTADCSEQPSSPTATETLFNESALESPKKTFDDIQKNGMALKPPPLLIDDDDDDENEEKEEELFSAKEEDSKINNSEKNDEDDDDDDFNDIENNKDKTASPEVSPLMPVEKKKRKTNTKPKESTAGDTEDQVAKSSSSQDKPVDEAPKKVRKKKSKTKHGSEGAIAPELTTANDTTTTTTTPKKTKKKTRDKTLSMNDAKVSSGDGSIDAASTKMKKSSKTNNAVEIEEVAPTEKTTKTKGEGNGEAEERVVKKEKVNRKSKAESATKTTRKKKKKDTE